MIKKLRRILSVIRRLFWLDDNFSKIDIKLRSSPKDPKILTGTLLSRLAINANIKKLEDAEFKVFSQFGDDGIIQYLIHNLAIEEKAFIEFGVEDYTESNTRFLLIKDTWRGLIFDGDQNNIEYIKNDLVSLFYDVIAQHAFINAENINTLIQKAGFTGRIGILSIDIDGVDYWVWKAITCVEPAIVIIEYNATFGPDRAITVPYKSDFIRINEHPSRLYWGASLSALINLGEEKGYKFIGCNSNGNNAYFLRNDLSEHTAVNNLTTQFNTASFAEYAKNGERVRGSAVLQTIAGLPVFNIKTGEIERL